MEKLFITIHDGETGEVETREMTNQEHQDYLIAQKQNLSYRKIEEDKIKAKKSAFAKLAALGLTEEEIAAL